MLSRSPSRTVVSAASRLTKLSQQLPASPSPAFTLAPVTRSQRSQQSSMANVKHYKLNNGAELPAIGFGTWQDKDAMEGAVLAALKAGYRHIDCAHVYGTEPAVRKAIKASGVPRSELFITSKLWNNSHHPDDVEKACDISLQELGLDYLDLFLMHWPASFKPSSELFPKDDAGKFIPGDIDYLDTYKAMEALVKKGKARAIGVSNFSQAEMERLVAHCSVTPAAHQFELHPYLQQRAFADWHRKHGIHVTHYSPFGNQNAIYDKGQGMGKLMDDPALAAIGKKHGKTGAQVALAWGLAQGHSVIPKSKTESRIKSNLEGDFKLDAADMKKIEAVNKKLRFNDPSGGFSYKLFTDLEGKE